MPLKFYLKHLGYKGKNVFVPGWVPRWGINNPFFFCRGKQTWIKDEYTNTQGWKKGKKKLCTHQKFELKISALKRHEKLWLFTWRRELLLSSLLWSEWHSDPGREQNNEKKKRNSSHSWLTALINKREGGGWGLCAFPLAASGGRVVITGKCQKTIVDFPN